MKIVESSFKISDHNLRDTGMYVLKHIEMIGRKAYKSEDAVTDESAIKFVKSVMDKKHYALLEHYSVSVMITCDRGVSHEIVRHRIASIVQESTRYCNYAKGKFGSQIEVVDPMKAMELEIGKKYQDIEITPSIFGQWYDLWIEAMDRAEHYYMELTKLGCPAQLARNVLPNSLKTELWLTMNLRNWRHFFQLRAAGTTGKPHPQMQELAVKMLKAFKDFIPIVFDDIIVGG